jgi:surface antigen
MLVSKSRLLLSGLTAVSVLGVGVAGATSLNIGAEQDAAQFSFLDVKADDNFDRNTNDVKSVITSSTDVSDDTAVLTNQILEMKKQAGVVKSDETTTEVAAVNPESVSEPVVVETVSEPVGETMVDEFVGEVTDVVSNVVTEDVIEQADINQEDVIEQADIDQEDVVEPETLESVNNDVVIENVTEDISESVVETESTEAKTTTDFVENVDSTVDNTVVDVVETEAPLDSIDTTIDTTTEEEPLVEDMIATEVETSIKPVVEEVASEPTYVEPVLTYDSNNTYPIGQCTWGAKVLAPWVGNYWGNANQWLVSGSAAGHTTGTTPQVGAVAVWTGGAGGYGHVAVVTAVDGDNIQVMEANYGGSAEQADPRGVGNYRGWFSASASGITGYVYP